MSVAQTRAARRRIKQRYRGGGKGRTVAQAIADERRKAARAAAAAKK